MIQRSIIKRFCKCGEEIKNLENNLLELDGLNWECQKCFFARTAKPEPECVPSEPDEISLSDINLSVTFEGELICQA